MTAGQNADHGVARKRKFLMIDQLRHGFAEYVCQFQEILWFDLLVSDAYDGMLDPSVSQKIESFLVAVDLKIETDHFGAEYPVERTDAYRHISVLVQSQLIYF